MIKCIGAQDGIRSGKPLLRIISQLSASFIYRRSVSTAVERKREGERRERRKERGEERRRERERGEGEKEEKERDERRKEERRERGRQKRRVGKLKRCESRQRRRQSSD